MQNYAWGHIPMVRIVLFYAVGILIGIQYLSAVRVLLLTIILASFLICAIALFSIEKKGRHLHITPLSGGLILICFMIAGMLLSTVHIKKRTITHDGKNKVIFSGIITQPPVEKKNSYLVVMKIDTIFTDESHQPIMCAAFFEKENALANFLPGQRIVANAFLNAIEPPLNPEQFDYRRYLYNEGITTQSYIPKDNWIITENTDGFLIRRWAHISRNFLLERYRNTIDKEENIAVLSALTLGYKETLDDKTVKAFSSSGAMHILAVSGLHVGIIYLLLSSFMRFGQNNRYMKIVRALVSIVVLWMYAFITGLSPSVTRAVVMFSFLLVGKTLDRQINIYNSLAASAFLLLLLDPFMITQVGFQLSYAAVTGIVFMQPKIYRVLYVKTYLLRQIWALVAVSVAAQIATLPFALYYFNQFPTYFFLTNILVIPLAYLILLSAVIFFATGFIPLLTTLAGKLLELLTSALNYIVSFIEFLPGSTLTGLYLEFWEFVLLAGITILIARLFNKRDKRVAFYTGAGILLMMASFTSGKYKDLNMQEMIVFNTPKQRTVLFTVGRKSLLYLSAGATPKQTDYNISGYLAKHGISITDTVYETDNLSNTYFNQVLKLEQTPQADVFFFYDKKILLLKKQIFSENAGDALPAFDYILLSSGNIWEMDDIIMKFPETAFVIDANVGYYNIQKIENNLKNNNVIYYNTNESGAFRLTGPAIFFDKKLES